DGIRDFHVTGVQTCALPILVATIPGREGDEAVLLAAHYDSVAAGPGAADDGAGVAALLEVARALKARRPPRRTVVLLFSDGEERSEERRVGEGRRRGGAAVQ